MMALNYVKETAIALIVLGLSAVPGHAAYVLRPGDILGITVIGLEGSQRRIMIDTDGRVYLPVIGEVNAEGKTVSGLREEVISRFSETAHRAPSGEVLRTFPPGSVLIEVAEYRPLYILGDVARPGELAFRPGITVLQALASAGGVGHFEANRYDANFSAAGLQVQVGVIRERIKQTRITIARLREHLESLTADATLNISDADESVRETADANAARSRARNLRHTQTTAMMEQLRNRLDILKEQEEGAQEAVDLDLEELARLEKLDRGGYVTAKPLLDARRSLLFSTSRALEISAERGNLELEFTRLSLSENVEDQLEAARILEELERNEAQLEVARAELHGTLTRMAMLGYAPQDVQGTPEVVVVRDGLDGSAEIAATPDMKLGPGDVLKVTVSVSLDDADETVGN